MLSFAVCVSATKETSFNTDIIAVRLTKQYKTHANDNAADLKEDESSAHADVEVFKSQPM